MENQEAVSRSQAESVSGAAVAIDLSKRPRTGETIIQTILFLCGLFSVLTTVGIVIVLGRESLTLFSSGDVNIFEFLTGRDWNPVIDQFGVWPLLLSTIITSTIAMMVALPLGLGSAIFLSEYASPGLRKVLKPILEVLAGIPTVVYGFFALTFMTPILKSIFGGGTVGFQNMASAGIVVGIMILPMVASMSEDALSSVPDALRQAAVGLGSTKFETSIKIVVPAALSGVIAAFIVAISRAVGETMIVAIAAGSGSKFTFNPFDAAETMTGYIARISGGDVSYGTPDYNSIFAIGLLLFTLTLILNLVSRVIVNRFREEYD